MGPQLAAEPVSGLSDAPGSNRGGQKCKQAAFLSDFQVFKMQIYNKSAVRIGYHIGFVGL
jgi:hypothetical protein